MGNQGNCKKIQRLLITFVRLASNAEPLTIFLLKLFFGFVQLCRDSFHLFFVVFPFHLIQIHGQFSQTENLSIFKLKPWVRKQDPVGTTMKSVVSWWWWWRRRVVIWCGGDMVWCGGNMVWCGGNMVVIWCGGNMVWWWYGVVVIWCGGLVVVWWWAAVPLRLWDVLYSDF